MSMYVVLVCCVRGEEPDTVLRGHIEMTPNAVAQH
jgi:hypothetical protein